MALRQVRGGKPGLFRHMRDYVGGKGGDMRLRNPFLRVGEFLTVKLKLEQAGKRNGALFQDLMALAPGNRDAIRQHYARKIADALLAAAVLAAVCLLVLTLSGSGSKPVKNGRLERPGYGMGDREEELEVRAEGRKERETVNVKVRERQYTAAQVDELLERARISLEETITGNNASLDQVRVALNFPAVLENGAVRVTWQTFPYGILEEDGTICGEPEEEGSLVEIQAILSCQGKELMYETAACIYPPVLTEGERFRRSLEHEIALADKESADQDSFSLPEKADGRELTWLQPREGLLPLFALLTVVFPCGLLVQADQRVREKAKARLLQMDLDYPELLWKLTMLLGAGLTIRAAFTRIAAEYRQEKPKTPRYAYEELLGICHEMQSGVPEAAAYENFGRRCGLPRYIKLGTLLSQNLKKGSKGLISLLEKEAVSSMEERRQAARKLGEQAGLRLIFPMILMFGVVLTVLIIPAFLSF